MISRKFFVAAAVASTVLSWAAVAQTPAKAPEAHGKMSPAKSMQRVKIATSMGDIVVEVDAEKAPKSAANFVQYVKGKHYDGTIFHRVINNFMIQGGGFTPDMSQKPTRGAIPIESNNGLKNVQYTLAMARTMDPNSATAQFFINVGDNAFLDYPGRDGAGYTVFGKVVSGNEVVDKIKLVPTGNSGPFQNVPTEPVLIKSATLVK